MQAIVWLRGSLLARAGVVVRESVLDGEIERVGVVGGGCVGLLANAAKTLPDGHDIEIDDFLASDRRGSADAGTESSPGTPRRNHS